MLVETLEAPNAGGEHSVLAVPIGLSVLVERHTVPMVLIGRSVLTGEPCDRDRRELSVYSSISMIDDPHLRIA